MPNLSDPADAALYKSSWGNIDLFASEIHVDNSRTQVVHELSSGDDHVVQDRGLRPRRVKVKLQFDEGFPGQNGIFDSPESAFTRFKAAVDTGARATFYHPLGGSFTASVGEFTWEIDCHTVITAEAEFIREGAITLGDVPMALAIGHGTGVEAAASVADRKLADVGMLKAATDKLWGFVNGLHASAAKATKILTDAAKDASINVSLGLLVDVPLNLNVGLSAQIAASAIAGARTSAQADVQAEVQASSTAGASVDANVFADAEASVSASASASALATATAAAFASVSASAAAFATAEARVGNFAAVTIDARIAVASWQIEGITTRQILIDVARLTDNISTVIEVGGLDHDLALWPAHRAMILLGESVRGAAVAATATVPTVFTVRVVHQTALLPLAARIYGGEAAQSRAHQIAALNDLSTPGWLPPGDYLMPTRSPAQRSPF